MAISSTAVAGIGARYVHSPHPGIRARKAIWTEPVSGMLPEPWFHLAQPTDSRRRKYARVQHLSLDVWPLASRSWRSFYRGHLYTQVTIQGGMVSRAGQSYLCPSIFHGPYAPVLGVLTTSSWKPMGRHRTPGTDRTSRGIKTIQTNILFLVPNEATKFFFLNPVYIPSYSIFYIVLSVT